MVTEQPPEFDSQKRSQPLPRGRNDLSPEEVAAHQRERILAGVATMLAERGYGDLTVENIITAARISRTTFYELFANKQEAVLFAQETLFARYFKAVQDVCDREQEWPQKVKAAIETTFDLAEANPTHAQLIAAGFLAGDPALAAQARNAHAQLADLLAEGRQQSPMGASLPPVTEQALVGGLRALIMRGLALSQAERDAMRSQLVELTLIPYLGSTQAAEVVAGG